MTRQELIHRIKERLQALYGPRFRGLVLYGSVARGDHGPHSDLDLLCLLEGPVNMIAEISPIVEALSDLQRENYQQIISVKAVDIEHFQRGAYPLVIEAAREGVPV